MPREWTVLTNVLEEIVVEAHDLPGALRTANQTHPGGEVVGVVEISPLTASPSKRPRGRPKGWRKNQTTGQGDLPQPVPRVETPHPERRRGRPRLHDREPGHCECGNPSLRPGTDDVRCERCRELEGQFLSASWEDHRVDHAIWPQFDSRQIENPRLARFIRRLNG